MVLDRHRGIPLQFGMTPGRPAWLGGEVISERCGRRACRRAAAAVVWV
ncbi:hypothetical protein CSE45_5153 [Citreicella sp. SE45]|nr:hypothetical protein CSE45_5153 [Citreicella sp. SE45]